MVVLFRIQDINELSAHIDLASMLYSKLFENNSVSIDSKLVI